MTKQLADLDLGDGVVVEVETSAPADDGGGGVGPAAQSTEERVIDMAEKVAPAVEKLVKPVMQRITDLPGKPDGVTLELGLKLGGSKGIIVAEGSGEANLKLTLTWSGSRDSEGSDG